MVDLTMKDIMDRLGILMYKRRLIYMYVSQKDKVQTLNTTQNMLTSNHNIQS